MFTKRREPIMLITYWYLCFRHVVSQALWFTIRCHRWASYCSASSPSTFFMIPSLKISFLAMLGNYDYWLNAPKEMKVMVNFGW